MFVLTTWHPDQSQPIPEVTHWREFNNAVEWYMRFMWGFGFDAKETDTDGVDYFYAVDASGGWVSITRIEAMEDKESVQEYLRNPWHRR